MQTQHELLIRRQEQLHRAALFDLASNVAGGAKGQAQHDAGLPPEAGSDLLQRELQIRCRRNQRRLPRRGGAGGQQGGQGQQKAAAHSVFGVMVI